MQQTISKITIETMVRNALQDFTQSPKRSTRNLIDMALYFSKGKDQKHFFEIVQTMVQTEKSAYCDLLNEVLKYVDTQHLLDFGMNLGYNSCTYGTKKIRENEEKRNYTIPWIVSMSLNENSLDHLERYDRLFQEGEELGIYTWLMEMNCDPTSFLTCTKQHTDGAFFLFLDPKQITSALMDVLSEQHHLMPVLRFTKDFAPACEKLRSRNLPYCCHTPYASNQDVDAIKHGDISSQVEALTPIFTIFYPGKDCSDTLIESAYEAISKLRNDQSYKTIPVELYENCRQINQVISHDTPSIQFNTAGNLIDSKGKILSSNLNLFKNKLEEFLIV